MARQIECRTCGHQYGFGEVEKKKIWENTQMKCPKCQETYSCLPPTEKKLRTLQDIYVINKSEEVFNAMYKILTLYVKSLILKSFSPKIHSPEELDFHVKNVITLLTKEYLKKDFKITSSFGGYLIQKIKQSLWGIDQRSVGDYTKKTKPPEWSPKDIFNDPHKEVSWIPEKQVTKEIIPSISLNYEFPDGKEIVYKSPYNFGEEIEREEFAVDLHKSIYDIIVNVGDECNELCEDCLRVIATHLHISEGENKADRFWKTHQTKKGKYMYVKTMEILRKELKRHFNEIVQ